MHSYADFLATMCVRASPAYITQDRNDLRAREHRGIVAAPIHRPKRVWLDTYGDCAAIVMSGKTYALVRPDG